MPLRAALFACLGALLLAGCRETQPALAPPSAEPRAPKLRKIAQGHSAQWTADGRIAYIHTRDGDIWSIRSDGKRARRLVRLKRDVDLMVSPDRSRLLLVRASRNLVAKMDGRRLRPIAAVPQAGPARWNDGGSTLSFQRERRLERSIWAVPVRGGPPKRLFGEFGGRVLAWSADGRMIVDAFQTVAGGSFRATLLFEPDREPREIPALAEARFGPDGTIEGIEAQGTLVQLDADGTILRRFSGTDPIRHLPDYTSDGTLMVYEQDERLWIAFADWSSPRVLADAACYEPAFSPDESEVVCSLIDRKGKERRRFVAVIGVPPELR